ncbi:hypothetical protein COV18_04530 [Candidatus Woesearchaeota archaeon CG10_big_fil_rev_8_21_14_0_10_37_12]|nr:MAG: hypothetical protein COV18_04530 [Candidatus Woesearchaeota archaeon CG10_big_fil_rev_8_21_14_0_10_37_12]
MRIRRITIVNIRKPVEYTLNEELQWFGEALGLFGERDRDRSCFRIFIELLKAVRITGGLTSDELAERLGLTRATVIHHLNTLMDKGIVIHDRYKYVMRSNNLMHLVHDLQQDMNRYLDEMKDVAEELDKILRL